VSVTIKSTLAGALWPASGWFLKGTARMSGDDRYPPHNDSSENGHLDPHEAERHQTDSTPASVVFMEMMRRAAQDHRVTHPSSGEVASGPMPEEVLQAQTTRRADEQRHAAALEAQRIRRVQRRQQRRRHRTVSMLGGLIRSLLLVGISAALMATILSWWTSPQSLNSQLQANLESARATGSAPLGALVPTPQPTPNWMRRIGILSGHLGPENDPGAVCPDGLTETEINFAVAQLVVMDLRGRGYTVDLLEEFDDRLGNYRAEALVSIHANDCRDYGERVSGYLVSQGRTRPVGGNDTRLQECIAAHYEVASGLERRMGLTRDMTDYHIFNRIHPNTPGIIIELGFMRDDRELLTGRPDLLARGIVNGVLCYLEPGAPEAEVLDDDFPVTAAPPESP
jgi:N-acetylmuramoyl-L-alanine amidase